MALAGVTVVTGKRYHMLSAEAGSVDKAQIYQAEGGVAVDDWLGVAAIIVMCVGVGALINEHDPAPDASTCSQELWEALTQRPIEQPRSRNLST